MGWDDDSNILDGDELWLGADIGNDDSSVDILDTVKLGANDGWRDGYSNKPPSPADPLLTIH